MTFWIIVAWIGIAAFFFAIPMSIAANLLTPKVAEWWAKTSIKRTEDRIVELRRHILLLEVLLAPTNRQESFVRGVRRLAFVFGLMMFIVSVGFIEAVQLLVFINKNAFPQFVAHASPPTSLPLLNLIALILVMACYLCGLYTLSLTSRDFWNASRSHVAKQLIGAQMELKRLERIVDNLTQKRKSLVKPSPSHEDT